MAKDKHSKLKVAGASSTDGGALQPPSLEARLAAVGSAAVSLPPPLPSPQRRRVFLPGIFNKPVESVVTGETVSTFTRSANQRKHDLRLWIANSPMILTPAYSISASVVKLRSTSKQATRLSASLSDSLVS